MKLKFHFLLYKLRWQTSWYFQLEIRSNKKGIAKKPLTNLYELNSTSDWILSCILKTQRSIVLVITNHIPIFVKVFDKHQAFSVKIGKDRAWSENIGCLPLAVIIMTTAYGRHPIFEVFRTFTLRIRILPHPNMHLYDHSFGVFLRYDTTINITTMQL